MGHLDEQVREGEEDERHQGDDADRDPEPDPVPGDRQAVAAGEQHRRDEADVCDHQQRQHVVRDVGFGDGLEGLHGGAVDVLDHGVDEGRAVRVAARAEDLVQVLDPGGRDDRQTGASIPPMFSRMSSVSVVPRRAIMQTPMAISAPTKIDWADVK